MTESNNPAPEQKTPQSLLAKFRTRWQQFSSTKKTILISAIILTLTTSFLGYWWLKRGSSTRKEVASPEGVINQGRKVDLELDPPALVKDSETPLDGIMVTKEEWNHIQERRPLAVIVENHLAARPVYGLNQAEIVYEALVEGGINRFMALYLRNQPSKVGPVRSLRTYYLDWLAGYNQPVIMHIGYAPPAPQSDRRCDVLAYISQYGTNSLGLTGRNFWRDSQRKGPHNAFSNTRDLWEAAAKKNWTELKEIEPWKFKNDAPIEERPDEQSLSLNWNGWGSTPYSTRWEYEAKTNRYLRFDQNNPSRDAGDNNNQIRAKNIVIQLNPQIAVNDSLNHILYTTVGEGEAKIFMDGQVTTGRWKKEHRLNRTKYYNQNNKEISLNRGRTWILVAPVNSELTH